MFNAFKMIQFYMMDNFLDTRVLLVERDDAIRHLFEIFLFSQGYSVSTARGPNEAFNVIVLVHPEVIFTSLVFHEMDGFKFCQRLRSLPQTKDSLIVALTGYSETDIERRTIEAGFDRFMLKPVSIHKMAELIEEHRAGQARQRLLKA